MNIPPTSATLRANGYAAAPLAPTSSATTASASQGAAVAIDTMPSAPPREVRDAIATAAAAWQRLAGSGGSIAFGVDPASGRVGARVTDATGVGRTLTPSQILAFAAGESINSTAA